MNLTQRDRWSGISPLRVVLALLGCALLPLLAYAAAPGWWSQRGVLVADATPDDYAPANIGQLKNIATAAAAEMDAKFPDGAGDILHALVGSWSVQNAQTNDFAPVNLGQLKAGAKPFYDRLIAVGLASAYPWASGQTADDFSVANIGQVKNLFSFDIIQIDPLYDGDNNGLPDLWERQYFGRTGVDPNADSDGDGLTNLQEFQQGSDPSDYFNGLTPVLTIVSGDNQQGNAGAYAADALMVELRSSTGALLANAPVTFAVSQGLGQLTATAELAPQSNMIDVRTGSSGTAIAYFTFPPLQNHKSAISARAGPPRKVASVLFQFTTSDLPVQVPLALPSPTPSPNPSATPPAPLHYALIDLGKGVRPIRLGNNDWVLVSSGFDTGQPFARWKAGVLEQLTYSDPSVYFEATDMNSTGTVVGTLYPQADVFSGQETEVAAGVVWQPDNPMATTKVSAPILAITPPFTRRAQVRGARVDAINDAGSLFGGVYTGWGYGSWFLHFPDPVVNLYRWSANGGGAQALTGGTAKNIGFDGAFPIARLNGPVLSNNNFGVMRANSSGRYIGRMVVPGFDPTSPTETGMVDSRSVSYNPWDVNENGIVAALSEDYNGMVIVNADGTRRDIEGANPAGINAFVRHEIDSQGQPKDTPAPQITGLWCPDYVRGCVPAVWEYAPNSDWIPHALQDLIPANTGWNLFDVADINDEGTIVGVADYKDPANPQAPSEARGFMLVPIGLVVDGNRDGQMSTSDPAIANDDITSQDRPYSFWLNDDDDTESQINELGGAALEVDTVPAVNPDYKKHQIVSKRNLEDFARLWLYLGVSQDKLISGEIQVGLRWKTVVSGTGPAINIYPSADGPGSDSYLKDEAAADAQLQSVFRTAVADKNNRQTVDSSATFIFKSDYWNGLSAKTPQKCLLFEGAAEGKGELEVVLLDQRGDVLVSGGSVWLELKNIKRMYQHQVLGGADPWAGLQFEPDPHEDNNAIIFVHGWRLSPDDTANFAETMFKRIWWRGFSGRYVAVRWDTYYNSTDQGWVPYVGQAIDAYLAKFNDSEHNAWLAGASLKDFIERMLPAEYAKNVVGHSMGNIVVASALAHGFVPDTYALLNAAIPAACYDDDPALQPMPTTKTAGPLGVHLWERDTSPDDDPDPATRAVAYRGRLKTVAGNLISFYLPEDYATSYAWELNNVLTKPPTGDEQRPEYGMLDASFTYEREATAGQKLAKRSFLGGIDHYLTDPDEAEPFACRTWAKAVGAEGNTRGRLSDSAIDLGGIPFSAPGRSDGFGQEHSGEFDLDIRRTATFFRELLRQLDVSQVE
jgi:hypothetical protein